MLRRVEWTPLARDDLAAIDAYYWPIDPELAERLIQEIDNAARFLTGAPRAGPMIEALDAHKWRVRATRYLLIYRIRSDAIEILRVFHASQDWQAEL